MQQEEMKAKIEKATLQLILSNPEQQILPNLMLPEFWNFFGFEFFLILKS